MKRSPAGGGFARARDAAAPGMASPESRSRSVSGGLHSTTGLEQVQQGLANATFEQPRQLMLLLVDRVVVTNDEVEVRYVLPTCLESEHVHFCQLRKGYFNNAPALEHLKAFGRIPAFADLDCPASESGDRLVQLVARIAAIGKDMAQPRVERADRGQHRHGSITILDIRRVDPQPAQMALRVGDDVALAALDLLAGIKAAGPPASVVFTDWLSMTPAEGLASQPAFSREAATRAWLIRSKVPSRDQA